MARELAPKLVVIFRHLGKGGNFPACWRLAAVVPVPKKSSFSDVRDYRPTSITPLLSNVFEKVVAGKFGNFLESISQLPPSRFSYRRGLGKCDALLILSNHLQAV